MEDSGAWILWIVLAAASVLLPIISKKMNKGEDQSDASKPNNMSTDEMPNEGRDAEFEERMSRDFRLTTPFTQISDDLNELARDDEETEAFGTEIPYTDATTAIQSGEQHEKHPVSDLDFDAKKAVIFSEILKTKFDE